jgi:hypothetical protein
MHPYGHIYTTDFLPTDRAATEKELEVAALLKDRVRQLRRNPDVPKGRTLARKRIYDDLSHEDLKGAGFVKSYVAAPEIGQSRLLTWRHPMNGIHLHHHEDEEGTPLLNMHIDTYPSATIYAKRLARERGGKLGLKGALDVLKEAGPHVAYEGIPGWNLWLHGKASGAKGHAKGGGKDVLRGIRNHALILAAGTLGGGLLTGKGILPGTARGALAGWSLTTALANRLRDWRARRAQEKGIELEPSAVDLLLGAVLPAAAGIAGGYAGYKFDQRYTFPALEKGKAFLKQRLKK